MKNNFKQFILCAAALLSVNAVFAGQDMPSGCPAAMSIAAAGVSVAKTMNNEIWAVIEPANTYQTNRVWSFVVEQIKGKSAQEVLAKVNKQLGYMVLTDSVRMEGNDGPAYYCLYEHETDADIVGIAGTPEIDIDSAVISRLTAKIRKKI